MYIKKSDHPHSPPTTPTHLKYTSIQTHQPPNTHKKCPPNPTHPQNTSIYHHSLPPTHKNVYPPSLTQNIPQVTPTHPKYAWTYLHPAPLTHNKCPLNPTHPKYISKTSFKEKLCIEAQLQIGYIFLFVWEKESFSDGSKQCLQGCF